MASGDLTYEEQLGQIVLDGAQKAALATFINTVWSGAIGNLSEVSVMRDGTNPSTIYCSLRGKRKCAPSALPIPSVVLEREV